MLVIFTSVLVVILLTVTLALPKGRIKNVHRVGPSPGLFYQKLPLAKRVFQSHGRKIIKDAYWKFKERNFVVQTLDMDVVVIAPHFLSEIRMLPESKMSHSVALVEKFLGYYSGVDVILDSRQHVDVCRLQLTQNLSVFVPRMHEAYAQARTRFFKQLPSDVPAYGFVFSMVLAITSTVFVGESLASDPAWQEVVSAYLKEVVATAKALKPYPRAIRPLLKPFLAPDRTMQAVYVKANRLLIQPILDRREGSSQDQDVMAFLARSQMQLDPERIVLQLMVLVSAALHTSTMAAVHALYDLCILPETAKMLREEVHQSLSSTGSWKLETIQKLRRLDSFLKESLRCNQPESLGYSRIVTSELELSDGTVLPRGTYIGMAAEAMAADPQFYTNPDQFDPLRFFRPGMDATRSNQSQEHEFAGIERGNVAWGSGRSTCPGRWYASAMNKLIIGDLLVQYKIKLPAGQEERPASVHDNGSIIPNPTQGLLFQTIQA